jgi:hypothetical protein
MRKPPKRRTDQSILNRPMTLLFAAATAAISVALKLPHPGLIFILLGYPPDWR